MTLLAQLTQVTNGFANALESSPEEELAKISPLWTWL
jgi:hypothetical protein